MPDGYDVLMAEIARICYKYCYQLAEGVYLTVPTVEDRDA
jgi:hypothetical protein